MLNMNVFKDAISRSRAAPEKDGIARGLFESAAGGRVPQRPSFSCSTGHPLKADK